MKFVDYERDYEINDTGKLSRGEYFKLIEKEYEREHGKIIDYVSGKHKNLKEYSV